METAVRDVLAEARPADAILGEEGGLTGAGGRRWIIDPIDGTAMFVAGDDRWLVLVALEEDGEIVAGVAAVPAQGALWWAERGAGAFQARIGDDGPARRLRVDPGGADTPDGARLGVVPDDGQVFPAEWTMLAPLTATARREPWPTHAALLVADGRLDLAVQTRGRSGTSRPRRSSCGRPADGTADSTGARATAPARRCSPGAPRCTRPP